MGVVLSVVAALGAGAVGHRRLRGAAVGAYGAATQRLNRSAAQRLNGSTAQRLNGSTAGAYGAGVRVLRVPVTR
ncbi:hypothetical protein GCM10022262_03960 [Georgenia daeguensis]|uniref:Uncharacterized protein n=1 Tax=Georgenia daeguensis TaxID=908355 RepID=A0ABP8EQ04_9MICO